MRIPTSPIINLTIMMCIDLQVKADEFLVELQSKAQALNNIDSEVQLISSLLQDLQTGLDNNKQLLVEVATLYAWYYWLK